MLPQISQWKSFIYGREGSKFFRNIATYLPNYTPFQKNRVLQINLSENFKSQKLPKLTEVKNNYQNYSFVVLCPATQLTITPHV